MAVDAQIDAHLKHQKSIFRPRAAEKTQKESPKNGLLKPFLGLLSLAGAEGLEANYSFILLYFAVLNCVIS